MIKVKIKLEQNGTLPKYMSENAAAMDCFADIREFNSKEDGFLIHEKDGLKLIYLEPGENVLVPLGFSLELPNGYEAQIRPRSGLAYKYKITILNSPGTIDADYRGIVKANVFNASKKSVAIIDGDRIAQLIIKQVEPVEWEKVNDLTQTTRGEKGHGSTGNRA